MTYSLARVHPLQTEKQTDDNHANTLTMKFWHLIIS